MITNGFSRPVNFVFFVFFVWAQLEHNEYSPNYGPAIFNKKWGASIVVKYFNLKVGKL